MTHGSDSMDSPVYGTFGNGSGRSPEPEPQYSLKMFGEVVKTFRKRARLTQEQFAPLVGYSPETIASIEQGRRLPPPDFAERADSILDAFGVILAAAKHLTRRKGLASWFRQWAELELSALSLYTHECRLIPGLLQTAAYARPCSPTSCRRSATSRSRRSSRLGWSVSDMLRERPNTSFSFILEEHLFLRDLGGEEVTRELLDHILDLSELRNVDVQIMPLVRHHHAGLDGPMRLAGDAGPPVVRLSGRAGARTVRLRPQGDQRTPDAVCQYAFTGSLVGRLQEPDAADARSEMSTTPLAWFKSSYSGGSGDSCVEVALSGTSPATAAAPVTTASRSPPAPPASTSVTPSSTRAPSSPSPRPPDPLPRVRRPRLTSGRLGNRHALRARARAPGGAWDGSGKVGSKLFGDAGRASGFSRACWTAWSGRHVRPRPGPVSIICSWSSTAEWSGVLLPALRPVPGRSDDHHARSPVPVRGVRGTRGAPCDVPPAVPPSRPVLAAPARRRRDRPGAPSVSGGQPFLRGPRRGGVLPPASTAFTSDSPSPAAMASAVAPAR